MKVGIVIGSAIVLLFMAMVGFHFFVPRHASVSKQKGDYQINLPFNRVRKILVKSDSLDEMIRYQHGEVLHQEWSNLNVSSSSLIRNGLDINGNGSFVIRTEDSEAGVLVLHFNQTIEITKTEMISKSWLVKPAGNLKQYETIMYMKASGDVTKVTNTVFLKYERRLPQNYISYMDEQVDQFAEQSIVKSREGMLHLISKYRDKRFIIPIRR